MAYVVGLWIAAGGAPDVRLVAIFVLGTILMRSAGCAINDWADREFRRRREAHGDATTGCRRDQRARGAVGRRSVCAIAALLLIPLNWPARFWRYRRSQLRRSTRSPRFFSIPQAILGIAFSMGIPMAFAAGRGAVDCRLADAGKLFWVLAFDTEYAMVDRDDDIRIGIRTSALFFGRFDAGGGVLLRRVHRDDGADRQRGRGCWFLSSASPWRVPWQCNTSG